jgi:hypothetical protein
MDLVPVFIILVGIAIFISLVVGIQSGKIRTNTVTEVQYRIHLIDGCQYVSATGSNALAHKGNCTNSIHLYRTLE